MGLFGGALSLGKGLFKKIRERRVKKGKKVFFGKAFGTYEKFGMPTPSGKEGKGLFAKLGAKFKGLFNKKGKAEEEALQMAQNRGYVSNSAVNGNQGDSTSKLAIAGIVAKILGLW